MSTSSRRRGIFDGPSNELPKPQQKPKEHVPPGNQNVQFTWRSALFCTTVSAAALAVWFYEEQRQKAMARAKTSENRVGKPTLGGPWTLVDGDGDVVSDSDMRGKYQLVYFGFTYCPDICPQELEKQAQVIEKLDKMFGEVVQPVFITVDPGRDTLAQVKAYVREFHPRLLGLTGTPQQIKRVTRLFRVYFNEGIRSGEEDYLVDHSIIQYLMGKNGKFKDFYGKNLTVSEMTNKIAEVIREDMQREQDKQKGIAVGDDE